MMKQVNSIKGNILSKAQLCLMVLTVAFATYSPVLADEKLDESLSKLINSVGKCWNVGLLSSEALHVIITVKAEFLIDGTPVADSLEMKSYENGSKEAAEEAYEAGRRAVLRCAKDGYDLPPDQYDQWSVLNLVFDPSGMRLR